VSGWDAFERVLDEQARLLARRAAESAKGADEEEVEQVRRTYYAAEDALVEVGRLLRDKQGYVVSESAMRIAAQIALIAFQNLLQTTALGVRAGYDEKFILAVATTYLFDAPMLASIAVVFRAMEVLPDEVVKMWSESAAEKKGEGRKKRKGNPPK
jgi:hypothetical protein